MESAPDYRQGHLVVAAVRVLGHTGEKPPTYEEIGKLLGISHEVVGVVARGLANHGIRHLGGFSDLAKRAQARNVAVSTVGVGVDYNERILSTVAFESNGRHYFAEDASSLATIFQAETTATASTVASGVRALIRLAPGVELLQVVDRDFHLDGGAVVVPLGTLAPQEVITASNCSTETAISSFFHWTWASSPSGSGSPLKESNANKRISSFTPCPSALCL